MQLVYVMMNLHFQYQPAKKCTVVQYAMTQTLLLNKQVKLNGNNLLQFDIVVLVFLNRLEGLSLSSLSKPISSAGSQS